MNRRSEPQIFARTILSDGCNGCVAPPAVRIFCLAYVHPALTHWANVLRTFGALKRGTGALQCPWRRAPVGSARSDSPIMSPGGDATSRFGGAPARISLLIRCGEGRESQLT